MNPSGGVGAAGAAAGVGEGAVFAGAVVFDGMAADELLADRDLDGVTDNGDPVGSLWYTALCFVIAGLSAFAALTVSASQTQKAPAPVG